MVLLLPLSHTTLASLRRTLLRGAVVQAGIGEVDISCEIIEGCIVSLSNNRPSRSLRNSLENFFNTVGGLIAITNCALHDEYSEIGTSFMIMFSLYYFPEFLIEVAKFFRPFSPSRSFSLIRPSTFSS